MARVNVQLVMLVALVAVMFSAPVISARSHILPFDKYLDILPLFSHRGGRGVMCVGEVAELLSQHEGRQRCAYDHKGGYRAIGCGYNMDDDADQRRKEMQSIMADYDKIYKGEECLNNMQISGLLIMDARRALDRVSENVKSLDDFCCSLKAVFADIQHTAGSTDNFPRKDMDQVIEKATSEDYKKAADELERTEWCSKRGNRDRCDDNLDLVERGC